MYDDDLEWDGGKGPIGFTDEWTEEWTQFPPIEGNPTEGPGWLSVLVIIGLFVLAAWTLS